MFCEGEALLFKVITEWIVSHKMAFQLDINFDFSKSRYAFIWVFTAAAPRDTISLLQGLVSALLADNKPSEVCTISNKKLHTSCVISSM